jgi:hypothetical protein
MLSIVNDKKKKTPKSNKQKQGARTIGVTRRKQMATTTKKKQVTKATRRR